MINKTSYSVDVLMPGLLKFLELKMIPNCAKRGGQLWPIKQELQFLGWSPTAILRVGAKPECYELLGQKYKFYLSFENSLCEDYGNTFRYLSY